MSICLIEALISQHQIASLEKMHISDNLTTSIICPSSRKAPVPSATNNHTNITFALTSPFFLIPLFYSRGSFSAMCRDFAMTYGPRCRATCRHCYIEELYRSFRMLPKSLKDLPTLLRTNLLNKNVRVCITRLFGRIRILLG